MNMGWNGEYNGWYREIINNLADTRINYTNKRKALKVTPNK